MTALRAERLRCEWLDNPLAVDRDKPRLSWIPVGGDGEAVTGAEVEVTTSTGSWLSGVLDGPICHVEYGGPALEAEQEAEWRVRLRGPESWGDWSLSARWGRGLPTEPAWRGAQWICGLQEEFERPDYRPSPQLRQEFDAGGPVVRARLYVTALGLYTASINGQRVGQAHLTPGYTHYEKRVQYQAYDVTELIEDGANAIGLTLGDGWYCGMLPYSATIRARSAVAPRVRALLSIQISDGRQEWIATDGAWRTRLGPILMADRYLGFSYDSRRATEGWTAPGHDDRGWSPVIVAEAPDDVDVVPSMVEPVLATEEVAALAITQPLLPGGAFVADFGQNIVGWTRLQVPAAPGLSVRVRHGEMVDAQGALYTANLWDTSAQTDVYITADTAQEYEPSFTLHGFRYAEILGYPGAVEPSAITAVVARTASRSTGTFECSNPMLNTLHDNIQRTQRGNFVEVPTDCPQRLERLGWMGDAQLFSDTSWFGYDVAAFWSRWLADVRLSQSDDGAFPNVVPPEAPFPPLGAPGWGDAGVIVPWLIYNVYGDDRLLAESLPSMQRWVELLERSASDLVYDPPHAWGDWLAVPPDQFEATRKDVLGTLYFAHSADLTARAAAALGDSKLESRMRHLFDDVRAAFEKAFVDADARITGETQTVYALALRFGVIADDKRAAAAQRLVDDIVARDWHLSTGIVGTSHLLPALSETGHVDVAYRLLEQTSYPSWGYSIEHGATTIWERWDGWTEDRGFQTPSMNSFNHYALGSVGAWMYQTVAGIRPETPGFGRVRIAPQPGGSLDWVKASYESVRGTIRSEWRRLPGGYELKVEIPPASTALLVLPDGQELDVAAGVHVLHSH
jgi:alpha-L-rhamnosidase